jgi:hypothetical protein
MTPLVYDITIAYILWLVLRSILRLVPRSILRLVK